MLTNFPILSCPLDSTSTSSFGYDHLSLRLLNGVYTLRSVLTWKYSIQTSSLFLRGFSLSAASFHSLLVLLDTLALRSMMERSLHVYVDLLWSVLHLFSAPTYFALIVPPSVLLSVLNCVM